MCVIYFPATCASLLLVARTTSYAIVFLVHLLGDDAFQDAPSLTLREVVHVVILWRRLDEPKINEVDIQSGSRATTVFSCMN